MKEFIEKYQDLLVGVLSGFDRVVLRGTLRPLSVPEGMLNFLYRIGVLLKDFGDYIQQTTTRLKQASLAEAKRLNRPIQYLASSSEDKDKIARKIMESDKIEKGLICVLSSVEPCMSFQLSRNKEKKKLQLERKWRKCLHLYHYWIDDEFGFISARLQTWFPFSIHIYLNGREWLSRKLDKAGIKYLKSDNCFLEIKNLAGAQALMKEQLKLKWSSAMDKIVDRVNPAFNEIIKGCKLSYYWSILQSEWAVECTHGAKMIWNSCWLYEVVNFVQMDFETGNWFKIYIRSWMISPLKRKEKEPLQESPGKYVYYVLMA